MAALRTEQFTPEVEQAITTAALAFSGSDTVLTVFEHGQWWIVLNGGATYSVIDAEGPGTFGGFDFEQVNDDE